MTSDKSSEKAKSTWNYEIVDQHLLSDGMTYIEYQVWESSEARARGDDPFLLNSHRSMIRESHQRILQDTDGKLIHVSGARIAPSEVEAFLKTDDRAFKRDLSGEFIDSRRRKVNPPTFPSFFGELEQLDPNWLRENLTLSIDSQVEQIISDYLARAAANNWVGDRRGTTLNLQVGASADDGLAASFLFSNNSTLVNGDGGSGASYNIWARFTGVSGLSGKIIDSAIYSLFNDIQSGNPLTKVFAEKLAAPVVPTNYANYAAKTATSVGADWNGLFPLAAAFNTKEIKTVIQELSDSLNPTAIQLLHKDNGSTDFAFRSAYSYDQNTARAPKLVIDSHDAGPPPPPVLTSTIRLSPGRRSSQVNLEGQRSSTVHLAGRKSPSITLSPGGVD